jgi:hypothetical protein
MAALTKERLDAETAAWREDLAARGHPVDAPASVAKGLTIPEVKVRDAALIKAVVSAVAPVIHELQTRVAALEARPALKYLGTWKENKTYSAGTFITDAGAVWYCNGSTTSRPGENADWSLAVKSGDHSAASLRSDAAPAHARDGSFNSANPRFR